MVFYKRSKLGRGRKLSEQTQVREQGMKMKEGGNPLLGQGWMVVTEPEVKKSGSRLGDRQGKTKLRIPDFLKAFSKTRCDGVIPATQERGCRMI
jgi:hypothetical protein